ncbi:MAG: DUF512 domain-containing protein [Symbiobacteriaceae bacterium]
MALHPLLQLLGGVDGIQGQPGRILAPAPAAPRPARAGLLPGRAMLDAILARGPFDAVLIPAESLNGDQVFIDDLPFAGMQDALGGTPVLPGYELTATLCEL